MIALILSLIGGFGVGLLAAGLYRDDKKLGKAGLSLALLVMIVQALVTFYLRSIQ